MPMVGGLDPPLSDEQIESGGALIRAAASGEELCLVADRPPTSTFGDVEDDRDAGSVELVTKRPHPSVCDQPGGHRPESEGDLVAIEPFVVELRC